MHERACSLIAAAVRDALVQRPERPLLVAIDGGSGAGKTTIVAHVMGLVSEPAVHIHSDDFFDAGRSETDWGLMDPAHRADACIDWRRLRHQALEPLLRGKQARWRPFDFASSSGLADHQVTLSPTAIIFLDGIYSTRPELLDLIALTVLVDAPHDLRRRRHDAREPSDETDWHALWDPAEDHYLTEVRPPRTFDLVVDGSGR